MVFSRIAARAAASPAKFCLPRVRPQVARGFATGAIRRAQTEIRKTTMTEEDFMVDPIQEFQMNYKAQDDLAHPEKRKTRHYTVNFVGSPLESAENGLRVGARGRKGGERWR